MTAPRPAVAPLGDAAGSLSRPFVLEGIHLSSTPPKRNHPLLNPSSLLFFSHLCRFFQPTRSPGILPACGGDLWFLSRCHCRIFLPSVRPPLRREATGTEWVDVGGCLGWGGSGRTSVTNPPSVHCHPGGSVKCRPPH